MFYLSVFSSVGIAFQLLLVFALWHNLALVFLVVLSLMLVSSYITRYVVQTLKATTAKARLSSILARLICAAMVAVVGSAPLFDGSLKWIS